MADGGPKNPNDMWNPQRVKQLVSNHDATWADRRYETELTTGIYETKFWPAYVGWGKAQGYFNDWNYTGTEIQVNRLRKMVRTYQGALYPTASRATLEADILGRGDAQVTQAVINACWKKPYAYVTVDHVVQMALTLPGAGFKIGYDPGTANPIERVWIRPIPPWELLIDRDAPSWEDERFRGHVYQAPIQDVIQRYPKLAGMNLIGTPRRDFMTDTRSGNSGGNGDDSTNSTIAGETGSDGVNAGSTGLFVRVLEFLNLRDCYVMPDNTSTKGRLEVYILDQGPEISGAPVFCGPLPMVDADGRSLPNIEPLLFDHEIGYPFRGLAPTKAAIPQQIELNMMRTAAAQDVRRNTRKFTFREGAIAEDELRKLTNGVDMQGVKLDPTAPPDAIQMLPHQAIAADTVAYTAACERDLDRQLGPSQNAQGEAIDTTAREALIIQLYAEEETKFHAKMLYGCLARVSKLLQCAVLLAGQDSGDSEGGDEAGALLPVGTSEPTAYTEADAVNDPVEPEQKVQPAPAPRAPKVQAFQPFPIMDGDDRLTVTAEALTGDFHISFVESDITPVNRQTVLQFLLGPGGQRYEQMWQVAQQPGGQGMLALRMMEHTAEALNLPRDMRPKAMLAEIKKDAEATAPKKGGKAAQFAGKAPPKEQAAPPEPPRSALLQQLQAIATALQQVPGSEDAVAAVGALAKAAQAGDRAAATSAVQAALAALPDGTPDDVRANLEALAKQLGPVAPAQGGAPTQAPAEQTAVDASTPTLADTNVPTVGSPS